MREQLEKQKQIIQKLHEENVALKRDTQTQNEELEKLKPRIEELKRMIFRRVTSHN